MCVFPKASHHLIFDQPPKALSLASDFFARSSALTSPTLNSPSSTSPTTSKGPTIFPITLAPSLGHRDFVNPPIPFPSTSSSSSFASPIAIVILIFAFIAVVVLGLRRIYKRRYVALPSEDIREQG